MLEEFDGVRTNVTVTDRHGRVWPAGTTGAIVDLRDTHATVEVDKTSDMVLVDLELDDLFPDANAGEQS